MVRQLKFQDRLVTLATAPLLVVAVVAAGLLLFVDSAGAKAYGIFALIGLGVSAVVAFVVGRSILASVRQLNTAIGEVADAHAKLASGQITAGDVPQLPIVNEDQLGDLSASINAINATTIEARESQRAAVKESLSNIVVNLARRSQTLLDRQVEYLDRLESSEEDPDRLGELFKVDHLATRMRRNAESLKVLAEADPGRRRGGPVEVADVLRVAMGEVENYEHIELTDVDDGQAEAGAAMDLAHLVAELMENATQFSPPESQVEVTGLFNPAGQFVISIQDHGMGMPDERFAESNAILADPPELGLSMSRSLGFMVIGRLAQRMGATVRLSPNEGGGTAAVVTVPAGIFKTRGQSNQTPTPTTSERPAAQPVSAASPALEKLLGLAPEKLKAADSPVERKAAQPESAPATARVEQKTDTAKPPRRKSKSKKASPSPAAKQDRREEAAAAPKTSADQNTEAETWTPPPVTADAPARVFEAPERLTEAIPSGQAFDSGVESLLDDKQTDDGAQPGLARRQRGASQVPIGQGRPVASSNRNPEEIRSMLSRYRDGLKDGKRQNVEEPATGNSDEASAKNNQRKDR